MFEILVFLTAGLGAGIITGVVSASAVIVMAPFLIVLLNYPPYLAIGIALAVDVFSSATAAFVYKRYKKVKVRPSAILLLFALLATVVGSQVSVDIPSVLLSAASGAGIILAGIFIYKTDKEQSSVFVRKLPFFKEHKNLSLALMGLWVGMVAGVFGAGGGVMILTGLTLVLDYDIREALGTSVFLMIFIALLGGAVHYINFAFSISALVFSGAGGTVGAYVSARIVSDSKDRNLNKWMGAVISVLGIILVIKAI